MEDSAKVNFAFGSKSEEKEENNSSPVKEDVELTKDELEAAMEDGDLDGEYTDRRTVTIALVRNYSLYRRVNDKVLQNRRDYIGSSINSSTILSSNKTEIETYFPALLGIAPNNPEFITRVKQYLNNIQIAVDELGKTFDCSFIYEHKSDYIKIRRKEEAIEEKYQSVNRNNLKAIKDALKTKIYELNLLESSKCKLGRPVNVTDYIMYRHCLLYNDIAKDVALINSDPSIRFYFKDDKKEKDKARKLRLETNKAKQNYIACIADNVLFEAMYIQYCLVKGLPIISSLEDDDIVKEQNLDKFSVDEPVKFNKLFNNKDIKLIATIEKLIARGELIRLPHNQNIMTSDGQFIGANMSEAVAWFKHPDNASVVNAYYSKLKNI
ncbi:hypothetical protein [Clostridium sp.]|uniref:hypothetical protein n=1 Tax=Clostridium sp. TaxID=1506 RepID=UPI0025BFB259|nr:hypothetical protein [Clostridium sp.]